MEMTIDEAIKHAEEVGNGCNECAAEHRQLAEWLRKYQKIEEAYKKYLNDMVTNIYADGKFIKALRGVLEDGKID